MSVALFMEMDRETALMVLAALPGLGPVTLSRLDEHLGGVEGLLEMSPEEQAQWCPAGVCAELAKWRQFCDPAKVTAECRRLDAEYLTFENRGYPAALLRFPDRPIGLYRMRVGLRLGEHCLAIVGTRRPSHYGRKIARLFAQAFVAAGFTVVSGMAEGIDTEAHRAALEAGGRTASFLGGGLNRCYPSSNRALMQEIAASAGVWTEFPLWRSADRRSFPQRNRIVAGVSAGVVVIESGLKGGSLITARMAAEQGKPVYAVPGRADAPESAGCHALIRDGCQLVTSPEEVLQDLNVMAVPLRASVPRQASSCGGSRLDLKGLEAEIWEALTQPMHLDRLSAELKRPYAEISSKALELELKGCLLRRLDGYYERL